MAQFLFSRIAGAKYLLVAEAIGYQGGRFTGIALVSERILLGHHKSIKPNVILPDYQGQRTSNPGYDGLKNTQKHLGFTEPTATIVWGEVIKSSVSPEQVMTWNMFPFHPFAQNRGPLTNRTPTTMELEVGAYYTKMLLTLLPKVTVVAIGRKAGRTLDTMGIKNTPVPHPANGGAGRFKEAIKKVLE